jgi:hypothetical protein
MLGIDYGWEVGQQRGSVSLRGIDMVDGGKIWSLKKNKKALYQVGVGWDEAACGSDCRSLSYTSLIWLKKEVILKELSSKN